MMSWGFGMGAGMWVSWILLTLVMALIVLLVLRASTPSGRPAEPPTASEILAERYARGGISTEEYEDRLSHLSS